MEMRVGPEQQTLSPAFSSDGVYDPEHGTVRTTDGRLS